MSSYTVTYTSISFDSDLPPWGLHLMDPDEFEAPEEAPQSPEQAPPSPDYVPGLEHLEYLALFDDEIPVEDQPLPVDASPTALSLVYVADFDPLDEEPDEDPANYPVDEGDDEEEEESSKDNEEEDEEAFEDNKEEEEHLALADSTLPDIDYVHSAEETKPFETNEEWKTVKPQPPMAASTEALIAEYAAAPTPPLPLPSLLTPLSSPLLRIPSSPLPLPSPPLLLPSTAHKYDIPEVGESSTAAAATQSGHTLACRVDYEFIDTVDASIRAFEGRVMIVLEEVNERVTDLATTHRQDVEEFHTRHQDD
ncbi:hypothetical protein Tco_0952571 [Tanacetum coccineum]|uniref:Uncharacterized protein n=1 Tax=Tanacetum coccineum TaxID=301880 RepID=A0ABQ5DXF1_9ASTR